MKNKIINIDFTRPDDRFLEKARAARDAEDLPRALQLYRSVVEKAPEEWEAGLEYAVLLWRCGCWRSSLRECYRLLSWHPEQEKLYGLIYRNLLALDMADNARYAYERYMMHLYKNPEDGLCLGEDDPPIPEKPTRKRYARLLERATRQMEKGNSDKANHLLMHANTGAFPRHDPLRTILEVHLMDQMGMEEEAAAVVDGMVQNRELDAAQAIALTTLMQRLRGAAYAGNLLLYAADVAQSVNEVYDTVRECILMNQPRLADSMLADILEAAPYRLDALYDRALIKLHLNDLNAAQRFINLCWQLDPGDGDVDYLYRLITEARQEKLAAKELLRLPLPLYGSTASSGRALALMNYRQMVELFLPKQVLAEMMGYMPQCRFLDCLQVMDPKLMQRFVRIAKKQEPAGEEAMLRMFLLFADPQGEILDMITARLSALGVEGEVANLQGGKLTTLTILPPETEAKPEA